MHHPAKAKRVIYLFMSGGPSHLDLWDYKPKLGEEFGKDLPDHAPGRSANNGHDLASENPSRGSEQVRLHQARQQ